MARETGLESKEKLHGGNGRQCAAETTPMGKRQADMMASTMKGTLGKVSDKIVAEHTPEEDEVAKRRTNFYSDMLPFREPTKSPRERAIRNSIVSAEVETNIIIQNEYDFLASLSTFLSVLYERPLCFILVTLHHTACMLFGGNFEPVYSLTISALPSLISPAVNQHCAGLLQSFFADELLCPPERGIVRFQAVGEENLATKGTTVLGEIDRESRLCQTTSSTIPSLARTSTLSKTKPSPFHVFQSSSQLLQPSQSLYTPPISPKDEYPLAAEQVEPNSKSLRGRSKSVGLAQKKKELEIDTSAIPVPEMPVKSPMDWRAEKAQKVGKRRSFLQLLAGRGGRGQE